MSAEPAGPSPDETALEKWPLGWAASYRRFEKFLATKEALWPVSGLRLVNEEAFVQSVPTSKPGERTMGITITARGRWSLKAASSPSEPKDLTYLAPGLYSIYAESSGPLGTQHHAPIVWFETVKTKPSRPDGLMNLERQKLRIVSAPGNGMAVWPNERLLGFLDFHIATKRLYRDTIEKENRSTSPSLKLRINEHGVVMRDTLTDERAESLLQWRIYHDGRLVETTSASGVTKHEMTHGFGNYLVLVGPEGPTGFLPVSNFLEFPLFPDKKNKHVVYPRDTDANGKPDFIKAMMDSGEIRNLDVPHDQDSDGDGLTDIEEVGPQPVETADSPNTEAAKLLQLWQQWDYQLQDRHRWW